MSELIEDNRCGKCRWHSKDGLFCENPNSDFYGWFRNDWKRCDKYEEREAQEMKQPLIICGFPGVGKTSCERWSRVLDAESSAFSHIIDPEKMTCRKIDEFPTNYINMVEIEMKSDRWDIILLSSHKSVRDELKRRKIKFVAVCPQIDCLSEYLGRYLKRGSDYDFMVDISNNWGKYLSDMEDEELCITLEKGQYLSDILPLF